MKSSTAALALAGACFVGFADPVHAEIKLNDTLSMDGFLAGSYTLDTPNPGVSSDHFGEDEALLMFRVSAAPVGAVFGLYHDPAAAAPTSLLDAYVTFDAAGGVTVTGGRFLCLVGYEAFHSVDNPTISFANNEFLTIAHSYHDGLKIERTGQAWAGGVAIMDSLHAGSGPNRGDGELKDNQGYEAYVSFKGVPDFVLNVSVGYDTPSTAAPASWVGDAWATWQLTPDTKLVVDHARKDGGRGDRGSNWLALVDHRVNDRWSAAFRVSGERLEGGGKFTRYTVTPALKLTPALTVRAELSRTDYQNSSVDNITSAGIQAFVRF